MARLTGLVLSAALMVTLSPLVFGCAAETSDPQAPQKSALEMSKELSGGGEEVPSGSLHTTERMSGMACTAHPGGAWACCDSGDDGTMCCTWGRTPGNQNGQFGNC
jgi:hypothetical protein